MEGEANYLECPNWDVQVDETTPEEVNVSNATRVPWSGSAMGLVDLSNLVPRGRSLMIGVLGAQNSGKTTFLIGNYLQLLKGYRISNSGFSGSRTLGAWESLAAYMRFEDAARNPSFPPHTPRGTSRVPGILHLALRNEKEEFRDVLLTDAPGEWFTRWSSKEDAPEAEGARWVVEHSDVFIIMADCDRLSGDQRGTARRETRELIERLGNHVENRPVILAWAKSDINPSEKIQEAIRRSLNDCIPHAVELNTTTSNHETLLEALSQAVNLAWYPPSVGEVISPVMCSKPYHAFRGHYANT
ncbi:MAG: GTPase domain-containing protein [Gammaproteobacteria bacterium]|nr:GTPase domain-containing protein [Gammaproteobacteria bacterium]MDH5653102.1 GTPase domain-containing protein [Gammaproteobacteria bacterium]